MYKKSLMIFRRDLRVEDNTALFEALKQSEEVFCCFIFNEKQIGEENSYRGIKFLQFMKHSLLDLQEQLEEQGGKLHLFYDKIDITLSQIKEQEEIEAVFFNKDYTPFARTRDNQIAKVCNSLSINVHTFDDALLLNSPEQGLKSDGTPYGVFTPFFKKNALEEVRLPQTKANYSPLSSKHLSFEYGKFPPIFEEENPNLALKGGRKEALALLNEKEKSLQKYQELRDYPILDATSHLSAHLRLGTISPRELYYWAKEHLGEEHPFIRQLYWRDFNYHVAYFHPRVFKESYLREFNDIEWENDKEKFTRWCEGKTGYPIVDAAMRELVTTGYMHNRCRMIVASFLTKDLHISWQWGEKFFAQHLVDYDVCLNNGNWQWAASTGCDASPYFRIFNPWLQQKKFDEHCEYIKKWVPELAHLDAKTIHKLSETRPLTIGEYPSLIVDHKTAADLTKILYKEAKEKYLAQKENS